VCEGVPFILDVSHAKIKGEMVRKVMERDKERRNEKQTFFFFVTNYFSGEWDLRKKLKSRRRKKILLRVEFCRKQKHLFRVCFKTKVIKSS